MPFAEPDVRVLFPVPLLTFQLADADALNAQLIAEVAARRKSEPGIERSNRYGWHSEPDLFQRKEPGHSALAAELRAMLTAATKKLIPDLPANLQRREDGWLNVSDTHAFNAPHDHAGVFWSGCYYVSVPLPADPKDKFSGAIEFIDPRGSIGSSATIETPFTRSKFTVRPSASHCLIWPSFMKHWVHPNNSPDERITAAFNAWFVRPPPGEVVRVRRS